MIQVTGTPGRWRDHRRDDGVSESGFQGVVHSYAVAHEEIEAEGRVFTESLTVEFANVEISTEEG